MSTVSIEKANAEMFNEFVIALKERNRMKRASNSIQSDGWQDKKYLPVWKVFEPVTRDINKNGKERQVRTFREVSKVCYVL